MRRWYNLLRATYILAAVAVFAGCTLAAPQANGLLSLFKSIKTKDVSQPVWLGSFNGRGAVLTPYQSEQFLVFANEYGDAIAFDGWSFRSIIGFSLDQPVTIVPTLTGYEIYVGSEIPLDINCAEFNHLEKFGVHSWSRDCDAGRFEIIVNSRGEIERISMDFQSLVTAEVQLHREG